MSNKQTGIDIKFRNLQKIEYSGEKEEQFKTEWGIFPTLFPSWRKLWCQVQSVDLQKKLDKKLFNICYPTKNPSWLQNNKMIS